MKLRGENKIPSRKDKILIYLKDSTKKEINNESLIKGTGIDRSNISKILKLLEKEGKIHRRYEQAGRSKFVWISLTNSSTNSQPRKQEEGNGLPEEKAPPKSLNNSTKSRPKNLTNSQSRTISQFRKDPFFNILEVEFIGEMCNRIIKQLKGKAEKQGEGSGNYRTVSKATKLKEKAEKIISNYVEV